MADKLQVDLVAGKAEKAISDVQKFRKELVTTDATAAKLKSTDSYAGRIDAQLARAKDRHKQFTDAVKSQTQSTSDSIASFIVQAGIGAALLKFGSDALKAAKEGEDSNRVLRASAVEAGLAYDQLIVKAENFGKTTALSNRDAQKTFAQIVTFANAAGRSDKLDEFTRKFADLAAAKGINASQLGDISRQLNALTDEATDKLLNANPSAFYDKFAKSLNKTAEQLTDAEKRAAVFDEVLRKGAIFSGEAERRMKGFAGETEQLRKQIDDLTESVGKGLVPIVKFGFFVGRIFAGKGGQFVSEDERKAIEENARILGELRATEFVKQLEASDKKIADARKNPKGSKENFILSQVDIAKTFIDPAGRDKAIKQATENAEIFIKTLKDRLGNALTSGSSGLAKFANAEFRKNINLFDADTRDKFINDFSSAIAQGFRETLAKTKVTVAELRKTLRELTKSPDLTQKDKAALTKDFQDAILGQINAGRARVQELGKSTDQLFANLFAKKGESNPFVKVFTEAQKAIEETRIATAGLSDELRKQAEQMVATQNANDLFAARLDSRLKAVDLRSDAQAFRSGGRAESDADFAARIDAQLRRLGFDPAKLQNLSPTQRANFAAIAQGNKFADVIGQNARAEETKVLTDAGLKRFLDFRDSQNRNTPINLGSARLDGVSLEALLQGTNLNAQQRRDETLTAGERLDRQLSALRSLSPENDQQRAEAERRIIALTQGLNPADLSQDQRNAAARARENEATRAENAEADAKKQRADALEVQKSIDANIKELLDTAKKDGLQGVIRIINEATDRATDSIGKRRRASDLDVKDLME